MINSAASRLLLSAARSLVQKRNASVIAIPPTNHVTSAEKYGLGLIMCSSFLVIPGWVLANIKNYRAKK